MTTGDEGGISNTMSKFGHLEEFHCNSESTDAYIKRVQLYFTAKEVKRQERGSRFLQFRGNYYSHSASQPSIVGKAKRQDYGHYFQCAGEPAFLVIAECYNFHKRSQTSSESVSKCIAVLQ